MTMQDNPSSELSSLVAFNEAVEDGDEFVLDRQKVLREAFEEIAVNLHFLNALASINEGDVEAEETEAYKRLLALVRSDVAHALVPFVKTGMTKHLDKLTAELSEVREGQHELLRMYEELRMLYPKHCLCANRKERAARELERLDLFAAEPNHEDYVPTGDDW